MKIKIAYSLIFLTTVHTFYPISMGQNLFQPRSFDSYSSRELYLIKGIYQSEEERNEWHMTLNALIETEQTLGCSNKLGSLPFWNGENTISYGMNDGESDLDAYQFGMGNIVEPGSLTLNPTVLRTGGIFMLDIIQYQDNPGFYFKVKIPLIILSINASLKEKVGTADKIANQELSSIWDTYPTVDYQYSTLSQAWQGAQLTKDNTLNSSDQHPIALQKGRFYAGQFTVIRTADTSATIGYHFILNPKGMLGLGVKLSLPTSNVPSSTYILEPITGCYGNLGIGADLAANYLVWEHEEDDRTLTFWAKGEAMHFFSGRKPGYRSFDLQQNGIGSKYLLVQYYQPGNPTTSLNSPPLTTANPTGRTPGSITQAVNLTTLPALSSFAIEGSFAVMLDYVSDEWNIGLGVEAWGRSKETLQLDTLNMIHNSSPNLNDYAVLGRQISNDASFYNPAFSLSSSNYNAQITLCEPLATIGKSENQVGVDKVIGLTFPAPLTTGYDRTKVMDARFDSNRIPASLDNALDVCGAAGQAIITMKTFGQIGYKFKYYRHTPTISLIGGAEFVINKANNIANVWSIGLQGSLLF